MVFNLLGAMVGILNEWISQLQTQQPGISSKGRGFFL
jgi:hypothetical protein